MTDEQRAVIDAAADTAQAEARDVVTNILANGITALEENGMTVYIPTEEEKAGWHEAYGPPCEEYLRGVVGDEVVDEFLAAVEECRS